VSATPPIRALGTAATPDTAMRSMAVAESNLAQNIRSSAPAKAMKDEGVTGAPTIWFTNKV